MSFWSRYLWHPLDCSSPSCIGSFAQRRMCLIASCVVHKSRPRQRFWRWTCWIQTQLTVCQTTLCLTSSSTFSKRMTVGGKWVSNLKTGIVSAIVFITIGQFKNFGLQVPNHWLQERKKEVKGFTPKFTAIQCFTRICTDIFSIVIPHQSSEVVA